ncbi:MAG: DUF2339 domain-containing protein [Ferruginibacter sp.]
MTPSNNDRIQILLDKLDALTKKQNNFSVEINELWNEINQLKIGEVKIQPEAQPGIIADISVVQKEMDALRITTETTYQKPKAYSNPQSNPAATGKFQPAVKSDIEKFIGENLINKIGIAITVIGVAIGTKYSIDHDLISPLTRIILGYLMGLGLLAFGIKLKKNYDNFSAVLVSGAIAILYFITYAAYSFYGLFPQAIAFVLMVIFTVFTVVAAIHYSKQVIAHIGLVGAYAVPFLLSDGSGKVEILFSYMAIINIGILIIAFKKYWKPLYYVSFILTWLIFFSWFVFRYSQSQHFNLALVFLTLFFVTFYLIFLAYKLLQKEKFGKTDVVLILANAFIFYGIGYAIISGHAKGEEFLGLFTLLNAIIHFIVGAIIYKQKLADKNLFFMIAGLVLVYITITIPVQLNGNWVTLLWSCEAALIFWIGRTKDVMVYEKLSYPLMFLAFISITQDWQTMYANTYSDSLEKRLTPLLNVIFLTSLIFIAAFAVINYINKKIPRDKQQNQKYFLTPIIDMAIPAILLVVIYFSFRMEISNYWNQLYLDSSINITRPNDENNYTLQNTNLLKFSKVWIIIYSMSFLTLLTFVNINMIKSRLLAFACLGLSVIVLLVFMSQGLFNLGELRESYLTKTTTGYYPVTEMNLWIRYIALAFMGLVLVSIYRQLKQVYIKPLFFNEMMAFDILLTTSILVIASNELITWMEIMHFSQSYKLGLSILWGLYALGLISIGIWKKKKHLRVAGIVLFSVTLVKLFLYDISHLDTIAKTIVFVSLGVLLLIISFLYNKYKHFLSEQK